MTAEKIQNHDQPFDLFSDIPAPFAVFRLIFDCSHSRVVNTRYVFVNDAYCQLAGYQKEELIGHDFLELYPSGEPWFPYCQQALTE